MPRTRIATSGSLAIVRRIVCLIGFIFGMALTVPAARGEEIPPVWTASSAQANAGDRASLWLNFLNPTASSVTRSFPAKIKCRIQAPHYDGESELALRNPADAGDAVIPAGGFARREYFLEVPTGLTGRAWLAFEQSGANPLTLEIVPAALANNPPRSPPIPAAANETANLKTSPAFDQADPLDFFKAHFFPHEPFYFIAGTKSPNAKFQISFKYQLFLGEGEVAEQVPLMTNLFAGYTQVSLWDWNKASAPFYDSNYKPEMLCSLRMIERGEWFDWFRLDLAGGFQHESNGRDGLSSRSINIAYLRPTLIFGEPDHFQVTLTPRGWVYLGDLSDNPDIGNYRGHVELRVVAGWEHAFQFNALLHAADGLRHGSAELGLSHPLFHVPGLKPSVFLYAQYFTGYGESLLSYNQRSSIFRVGFSLFR